MLMFIPTIQVYDQYEVKQDYPAHSFKISDTERCCHIEEQTNKIKDVLASWTQDVHFKLTRCYSKPSYSLRSY